MFKSTCLIFALIFIASTLPHNEAAELKANAQVLEIPLSMMTRSVDDYLLVKTQMDFHAARSYCIERHLSLISLKTFEDQINFMGFLTAVGSRENEYRISGNRLGEPWVWGINGSPLTYTNWGKGEPNNQGGNQKCMSTFQNTQYWDDVSCDRGIYFVCERR